MWFILVDFFSIVLFFLILMIRAAYNQSISRRNQSGLDSKGKIIVMVVELVNHIVKIQCYIINIENCIFIISFYLYF